MSVCLSVHSSISTYRLFLSSFPSSQRLLFLHSFATSFPPSRLHLFPFSTLVFPFFFATYLFLLPTILYFLLSSSIFPLVLPSIPCPYVPNVSSLEDQNRSKALRIRP